MSQLPCFVRLKSLKLKMKSSSYISDEEVSRIVECLVRNSPLVEVDIIDCWVICRLNSSGRELEILNFFSFCFIFLFPFLPYALNFRMLYYEHLVMPLKDFIIHHLWGTWSSVHMVYPFNVSNIFTVWLMTSKQQVSILFQLVLVYVWMREMLLLTLELAN